MTCPECHGTGDTYAVVHGHIQNCRCDRCAGSGVVPDEMAEWIRIGAAMREQRVNGERYRSIHEEAHRRGMDSATLSAMEHGKIKPNPEEK